MDLHSKDESGKGFTRGLTNRCGDVVAERVLSDELSIHPHKRVYATLGSVPSRCSVVRVRSGGCFEH